MKGLISTVPLNEVRNAHIWTPQYVQQPELAWLTQQVSVNSRGFFSFYSQERQKSLCISSVEVDRKDYIMTERVIIRLRKPAFTFVLLKFPNDPSKSVSTSFMKVWSNLTPTESAKTWHLWLILPSLPVHLTEIQVWRRVGDISPNLDGLCKT